MNKLIAGLLGPLLLCACASMLAPDKPLPWDPRVLQGQLPNGLQYRLLRETAQAGRVDVRLTIKAGSVDEDDDQIGVAHLVEHLAFYSHGQQPGTVRSRLQALGWEQGKHFNAQTTYDRTQYLLSPTGGSAQINPALEALADLAFAADYSAADLDHERPIVIEEWRGGLGVAQRMNQQRTASQRAGSRYPAHRTIGNETAIREARLPALLAYQQRWYQPQNMVLTVVGDIDPQTVLAGLELTFGKHPATPMPPRGQRDLPLDNQLKVFQLQDSQSGSNQVALLFRLHEPASRANSLAGLRERIIDRLALSSLVSQLRRQPLGSGVRSLTAQKTTIGDQSTVLGVAAGVDANHHAQALTQLLSELERLRRHGLQQADMDAEREQIRGLALRMQHTPTEKTFEKWVTDLNDAAIQDKVVQRPQDIAQAYLSQLDGIHLAEVNQRLRRWLGSPDQVLQVSAPGLSPLRLPSVSEVLQQQAALQQQPLAAPATRQLTAATAPALPTLPAPAGGGRIVQRQRFAAEQVEHWALSNGDRLVWLRRNGEQGRYVLKAQSSAGFMAQGMLAWRTQMATQLAINSGPPGWSADAVQQWRRGQALTLGLDQQAQHLVISLTAAPTPGAMAGLLQGYRLSQTAQVIDPLLFEEAQADLLSRLQRQHDSISEQKAERLSALLMAGKAPGTSPDADTLQALQAQDLERDWQQLSQAPVTYYLMADVPVADLEALVSRELAAIPRGKALIGTSAVQQPGQRQAQLAIAVEPRASLQMQRYSERRWSPEDAVRVAALREVVRQQLKTALRAEATGIYRLDYDAELNPDTQRIESRLSFTSDPARVEELWQRAQATLARLPKRLTEADVKRLRAHLQQQENLRRQDPQTQLRRLMLSERQWGDPRYLSQQASLADALDLASLRALARQLALDANTVQLRLLPAPVTAQAQP
ncbi:MAG: insulinase family protein [Pseudomonas sp.]|uniref:M16 family metallopeptidase n=1 Tax=Pseudomonas abieticivorans TaxID=2931382 RepID=UPI0020C0B453|nr:insulinase family protein [Pseudomonas sp. PIA16]MDE1169143.1 insulinase family protein [Pseudomonas sp.]